MKREEKIQIIEALAEKLQSSKVFYLADTSELNVETVNKLRRLCYRRNISMQVVKNTFLKQALEKAEGDFEPFYDILKGPTSLMFAETGNAPAKLIKEFRKNSPKPLLKGAYVEEVCYNLGEEQLDALSNIKSKNELIGDIVLLLQSPAKNVVSALQSGGGKLAGILKTLSEKQES